MFQNQRIHFIGIGGSGMSGIAEVLINMGHQVTGSDMRDSAVVDRLRLLGGTIEIGHKAEHIKDVDVVVRSTAIPDHNVEIQAAQQQQIPIIPRAEMLAELMRMKYGIAVAGTHGKTTTTSMLATILYKARLDPTVVIGGRLNAFESSARLGSGQFIVAEADESDGSFMLLTPTISIITNIDPEHMSHWKSEKALIEGFTNFAKKVPFFGFSVLCLDHPVVQSIIPQIKRKVITYGFSTQAELSAESFVQKELQTQCVLRHRDQILGELTLNMPGKHNMLNAMAATAVALGLGVQFPVIAESLKSFTGVDRRFTIVLDKHIDFKQKNLDDQENKNQKITLIDDYAHHPVEIQATLKAAAQAWPTRRKIALFQPHRYSRIEELKEDFLRSFNDANIVFVLPVYAAGEQPIPNCSADVLVKGITDHGHKSVSELPSLEKACDHIFEILEPGDVIISLGAGNINWVLYALRDKLL
ncbi:MAG: UDP-N-acetylmuramate--L-alanine ligase [Proteobacteria bacterium]|nr:UDP-N-acetylmuramate--L-alanine ligase [Pseudomonadota bacterium]